MEYWCSVCVCAACTQPPYTSQTQQCKRLFDMIDAMSNNDKLRLSSQLKVIFDWILFALSHRISNLIMIMERNLLICGLPYFVEHNKLRFRWDAMWNVFGRWIFFSLSLLLLDVCCCPLLYLLECTYKHSNLIYSSRRGDKCGRSREKKI